VRTQALSGGSGDQVSGSQVGPGRGAAVLDDPDQEAVPLGQADRAAQLAGSSSRSKADAELRPERELATAERVEASTQAVVGRQCEVEALPQPVGRDPQQPSVGVHHRTARRAPRQGRGVLDATTDPPPPRTAEGTVDG